MSIKRKNILFLVMLAHMCLLAGCNSDDSDSSNISSYSSNTTTEYNYLETTEEKGETVTISTGTYEVGSDIAAGKYDVDYVSGHYALFSVKESRDALGASPSFVMGDRTAGDDVQHYSNLYLVSGNVVVIEGGNLTVKLTPR